MDKIFELNKKENKIPKNIMLRPSISTKFSDIAKRNNISLSALIEIALKNIENKL